MIGAHVAETIGVSPLPKSNRSPQKCINENIYRYSDGLLFGPLDCHNGKLGILCAEFRRDRCDLSCARLFCVRGFLLGAAEWLLMSGGGAIRASQMETMDGVGMMIAASAMAPLLMVAVCLIGFAIMHFWRRKMEPEQSTSITTLSLQ